MQYLIYLNLISENVSPGPEFRSDGAVPSPLLTTALSPKFETYIAAKRKGQSDAFKEEEGGAEAIRKQDAAPDDLPSLLNQLPSAHWFLLADIGELLFDTSRFRCRSADDKIVKLLDLIPQHARVNRMTLNAVMLSLGPSLNIPGGILTELLERRSILFASPPPLSGTESAISLIDFGDTSISPPHLPGVLQPPAQDLKDSPLPVDSPRKISVAPTWLPGKPSIPRLASNGSMAVAQKPSVETTRPWKVDKSPPRLGLPTSITSKPPAFATDLKPVERDFVQLNEPGYSLTAEHDEVKKRHSADSPPSRPVSTPIADLYRASEASLPSLRPQKSDNGLSASSTFVSKILSDTQIPRLGEVRPVKGVSSATHASVFRQGPPVFSQPIGVPERSGRTPSVKRKDDSPTLSLVSSGTEGDEGGRVKRLSAGPGAVSVREAVRTMEMTA